jgi:hypothetical protein
VDENEQLQGMIEKKTYIGLVSGLTSLFFSSGDPISAAYVSVKGRR